MINKFYYIENLDSTQKTILDDITYIKFLRVLKKNGFTEQFLGMGGVGASKSESKSSSSMEAEASVMQNKDMSKEAALSEKLDKKTTKVQKMVGQMADNVIRYEMFLKGMKSYNF